LVADVLNFVIVETIHGHVVGEQGPGLGAGVGKVVLFCCVTNCRVASSEIRTASDSAPGERRRKEDSGTALAQRPGKEDSGTALAEKKTLAPPSRPRVTAAPPGKEDSGTALAEKKTLAPPSPRALA